MSDAERDAWQQLQSTLERRQIAFELVSIVADGAPPLNEDVAIDPAGHARQMFDAQAGSVYLLRPDGHVLARWRDGTPEAVEHALDATLKL
jgi:3-(3-hydroxy-phenyl)propionate hydroxylase